MREGIRSLFHSNGRLIATVSWGEILCKETLGRQTKFKMASNYLSLKQCTIWVAEVKCSRLLYYWILHYARCDNLRGRQPSTALNLEQLRIILVVFSWVLLNRRLLIINLRTFHIIRLDDKWVLNSVFPIFFLALLLHYRELSSQMGAAPRVWDKVQPSL